MTFIPVEFSLCRHS